MPYEHSAVSSTLFIPLKIQLIFIALESDSPFQCYSIVVTELFLLLSTSFVLLQVFIIINLINEETIRHEPMNKISVHDYMFS